MDEKCHNKYYWLHALYEDQKYLIRERVRKRNIKLDKKNM